jgi:TrmH family RNA methyltransferase
MKSITSRDNALYKELKQLASSSQARRKAARTLLDGVHLCEADLQHAGGPARCIVNEDSRRHDEVAAILEKCEGMGTQCIVLPDSLYQSLSQVENGIGLLFVIDTPAVDVPREIATSAVLLDNLQDPGNLGSILRSAAAAGIQQVFCSRGTVFAWSPKVLRAGMGAHFLLEIFENADLASLLCASKIPVMATSSHAERRIFDVDLRRPVAWLFGHEGQGLSDDLLAHASCQVRIPHVGQMESLNVAASAAICFFEQLRQTVAAAAE